MNGKGWFPRSRVGLRLLVPSLTRRATFVRASRTRRGLIASVRIAIKLSYVNVDETSVVLRCEASQEILAILQWPKTKLYTENGRPASCFSPNLRQLSGGQFRRSAIGHHEYDIRLQVQTS